MLIPKKDSAQIRIPPPFVVLSGIVLSWGIKFFVSYSFLPDAFSGWIGGGILFLGILLMFRCAMLFKKNKTNIEPWKPTLTIMREGPYRFSRNPIYLSFLVILFGAICILNNLAALPILIPLYLFLRCYVIKNEERYLTEKFGESYLDFKKTTRRWL